MTQVKVGYGKLKELKGSITQTQNAGLQFLLNPVNQACNLDQDLVNELNNKWRNVKGDLKTWYNNPSFYKMGNIRDLAVQSDMWIIHMLCKDKDLKFEDKSLKECLKKVADLAKYEQASIHFSEKTVNEFPKMMDLIEEFFLKKNISVSIYKD